MAQKYKTQGGALFDKFVFCRPCAQSTSRARPNLHLQRALRTHITPAVSQLPQYFFGRCAGGYGSASTAEQVAEDWEGKGKVVVMTGASAGLGAEATRVLAERGATVVMLVRDLAAAEKVKASVTAAHPTCDIRVIKCELDSLASVAKAAQEFIDMKLPLHVLMLNAGVMACPFTLTKDGIELQMGVNHVAHFLLTRMLLPTMIKTASAPGAPHGRIVSLSSVGHSNAPRRGMRSRAKINSEKGYGEWFAYGQSKLANILFPRELSVRLKDAGITNVDAVSVHPGVILSTSLWRHLPVGQRCVSVLNTLTRPFCKTTPQGAATQVYVATAPKVAPGEYYQDCHIAPSSLQAHDAVLGNKLWSWSDEVIAPFLPKEAAADTSVAWWDAQRIPVPRVSEDK